MRLIPLSSVLFFKISFIGVVGLIVISVILILLSSAMFFFIARKRKKTDLTLHSFSVDVRHMLEKLNSPHDKINALKGLMNRIENDERYDKTPDWKKSVQVKVYEHMVAIYYETGDETGVIETTSEIIKLDPGNGLSYYNRGSIYNNQKEYEKALADFNDAILLMPDYSSAYNNRGIALDKLGRYEEALSDFGYAIALEPSAITYFNRANLLVELKEYLNAKKDYLKYIETDSDNRHALKDDALLAIKYIDRKLSETEI